MNWVLLAYRLPREPSTPRISLWRKLRRLGALQVVDGLVALPADARTREQLDWLADEVLEAGGEATVWIAQPGSNAQDRALALRMRAAAAAEYAALADEARSADGSPRSLARLRRALRAIRSRDYFPAPEREEAVQALDELARTAEVTSS